MILARHGNSEVALTRNFAETDGIIVHTLLLRRQGTAERPLARYTIPFDLTRGAEGLGCNDLPLEIAPRGGTIAIEELARKQSVMLAHADWPSPVSITIHIPIIDGAFRQRVDNVGGIGITYDVGCAANPFAR